MSDRTTILPSRIVQYDDNNSIALCEDGSVWEYLDIQKIWKQIHPPHKPSTQSDDFKEALYWLEMLWHNPESHEVLGSVLAFLRKHGRVK